MRPPSPLPFEIPFQIRSVCDHRQKGLRFQKYPQIRLAVLSGIAYFSWEESQSEPQIRSFPPNCDDICTGLILHCLFCTALLAQIHQIMAAWGPIRLFLLALLVAASQAYNKDALRLKLVHRSSHESPFGRKFSTLEERLEDIVRQDSIRVHGLQRAIGRGIQYNRLVGQGFDSPWEQSASYRRKNYKAPLISGASTGSGQYFVHFYIGTPPQKFMLIADTGSDLVWVGCSACRECRNRKPGSAFLARHSSSFAPVHCYAPACRLVPPPPNDSCNHTRLHSSCKYDYVYADLSDSSGIFAHETATLNTSSGSRVRIRNVAFGCGFRSTGPSFTGPTFGAANGVMGLGKGAISLTSQIGERVGNKFSYCLVDYTISPPQSSYLTLGESALKPALKESIRYTPFLKNPFAETFYYVGIRQVLVGGVVLPIHASVWDIDVAGNGGTVIDSGTTLTFIVQPAYRLMLKAFEKNVIYPRVRPVQNFDLCFNVSGISNPKLPKLTIVFKDNAAFDPLPSNYFINPADDVKCLAIQGVSSPSAFSILGNLLQQNFFIVYDRENSRLGFANTDCSAS